MATISVSATATLSANGNSTSSGTMTWTAPSLPDGAVVTGITVTGSWSWNGRGSISRLTVNGISTSEDVAFSVSVGTSATSTALTCHGGNKNATGSNFRWTGLQAVYTYEVPSSGPELYVKSGGSWVQVQTAYRKINGSWQQVELDEAFQEGVNYKVAS